LLPQDKLHAKPKATTLQLPLLPPPPSPPLLLLLLLLLLVAWIRSLLPC
jgi:hypothetical protein